MAVQKFNTFGCEDAALLEPASGGATVHDILGIQSVDLGIDADSFQVLGDDEILDTWNHSQKGKLKFKTSFFDPDIYSMITGDEVITDGTGENQVDAVHLGTGAILEAETTCFRFLLKSKTDGGTERKFRVYVYRARIINVTPDGWQGKQGGTWTWEFELLKSSTDELLQEVDPAAMARIEVGPAVV